MAVFQTLKMTQYPTYLLMSGEINAVGEIHGTGYIKWSGNIVGVTTWVGSGLGKLVGTCNGLFNGNVDLTITKGYAGSYNVNGTMGNSTVSANYTVAGPPDIPIAGTYISNGPLAPVVTSIDVSSSYNSFTTRLYNIAGANFVDGATIKLGLVSLTDVAFINEDGTLLAGTIPANIAPGIYDLVVTNPDLQTGTLHNAFTVLLAPSPTVGTRIILDTVTRVDSLVSAGSSESPILPYAAYGDASSWGVLGDQIYCTAVGTTPFGYSLLQLTSAKYSDNFALQADIYPNTGGAGLIFRATDKDNYYYINYAESSNQAFNISLDKVEGGVNNDTTLDNRFIDFGSPQTKLTLRVEVSGTQISVFVNGGFVCRVNNSFNQSATDLGLLSFGTVGEGTNNIRVETIIPFTPAALPAMPGWWKADAIVGFNDGDSLTSWLDSSGNGNSLGLGGLSTIAPIYHTNVQNSLPGVTFADVPATSLYTPNVTMTDPFSVFVVYSYDGAISGAHRMFHGEGTNWLIGPYNGGYQTFGGGGFASNPPAVVQNAFVYQTTVQVVGNLDNYVNGVYRGSVVPNTAPNNVTVGAYGGETLGGRVLEVIPVNWAADAYLLNLVWTYLVAKWGL